MLSIINRRSKIMLYLCHSEKAYLSKSSIFLLRHIMSDNICFHITYLICGIKKRHGCKIMCKMYGKNDFKFYFCFFSLGPRRRKCHFYIQGPQAFAFVLSLFSTTNYTKVQFKINLILLKVIFLKKEVTYSNSINIFLNHCVGSNWRKGQ